MWYILAYALATQPPPSWQKVVVPLLTLIIYGILGPAVYLTIVLVGVELAWPGGTRMRTWLEKHRRADCPTTSSLAEDPTFRIECVVAGLIALSVWSVVITAWLAGYLRGIQWAPQLAITQYTTRHAVIFGITLIVGLIGGYAWIQGMRRAGGARASMGTLAVSMSLAGTLLFFYAAESNVRDLLLVLALGTFVGELVASAGHPTFIIEGLFAELFIPAHPSSNPLAGLLGGNKVDVEEEASSRYVGGTWQSDHHTANRTTNHEITRQDGHAAASGVPSVRVTQKLGADSTIGSVGSEAKRSPTS